MIERLKQNLQGGGDSGNRASGKSGSDGSEKQSVFSANRTTILMGLAFLAGLGWVVMARLSAKPFVQTAVESGNNFMIEMGVGDMRKQLTHGDKELDPEVNKMVDTFYVDASERQIPVSELKKKPFAQYVPDVPDDEDQGGNPNAQDDKLDQGPSVEGLKLQMILIGSGARSATISGFVMHEGDIINGWKILQIKPNQVVMKNADVEYVLNRHMPSMSRSAAVGKQ